MPGDAPTSKESVKDAVKESVKESVKDPIIHVLKNGITPKEDDDLQPTVDAVSRKLFQDVAPSIVKIQCDDGSGSGFFVDKKGDIATNAHVVLGCDVLSVVTADGKKHDARIVKLDDINDLAVLRIDDADKTAIKPLQLGESKNLQADQSVWAFGHPAGLEPTYISPGYYRHAETAQDVLNAEGKEFVHGARKLMDTMTPKERADAEADLKRPLFNAMVNIQKGDSGGALVDATGKVIGINDLSNLESNSDFIPVEKLKALLSETQPKFNFTYKQTELGLFLTDISRSDGSYRAPFEDNVVIQGGHSKAPNAVPNCGLSPGRERDGNIKYQLYNFARTTKSH